MVPGDNKMETKIQHVVSKELRFHERICQSLFYQKIYFFHLQSCEVVHIEARHFAKQSKAQEASSEPLNMREIIFFNVAYWRTEDIAILCEHFTEP